jgi:hypothetical protein
VRHITMTGSARRLIAALAGAALFGCGEPTRPDERPAPDVTGAVEHLGNPFTVALPYARNVWDMQLFGGRIHLGHGDSIENWGPVTLWSLDPVSGGLSADFTTTDEQVDAFRVLGGALYVPGHDPRDDWSLGNFYRLDGAGWAKHRSIPHGLHAFDLALHGGRLFAALGTEEIEGQPALLVSSDGGGSWAPVTANVNRFYNFFELRGVLYAVPVLRNSPDPARGVLHRFDGTRFVETGITGAMLIPDVPADRLGRMLRPTPFAGALLYIPARETFDWRPVALMVTRTLEDAARVALPDPAARPYDLLVRGGTLYVLAAAPAPGGGHTVYVYATEDAVRYRELFHFRAETFARSFEERAGDFFFGLGSGYDAPSPATGDLLRVRRAAYAD